MKACNCDLKASWLQCTCEGEVPPKIWPVIMPGMETTPMTLIWLSTGVRASTRQRCRVSLVASMRVAPIASSSSMRPLPAIAHCVQSTAVCRFSHTIGEGYEGSCCVSSLMCAVALTGAFQH